MRALAVLLALTIACASSAHEPAAVTTVILVRHAEKAPDPALKDPPLTAAGEDRARELARVLAGTAVDAVFTTQWERTRKTAVPLAESKKLQPVAIQSGATYAAEVVARIQKEHRGQTVVVVGHSNSTQHVLKELGIRDAPFIPESEYDNFFVVTLATGHAPRSVALRYGAAVR